MTVVPTGGALGVEIRGLDLRDPMPQDTVTAVRRAVLDHCLVLFRGQTIGEREQVEFTRYFGEPAVHVRDQPDRATDEIMIVSNVEENGKPIGALGHRETSTGAPRCGTSWRTSLRSRCRTTGYRGG